MADSRSALEKDPGIVILELCSKWNHLGRFKNSQWLSFTPYQLYQKLLWWDMGLSSF